MNPTGIEAEVCRDITERQQLGIKKYGTTVADNDLSLLEWHRHHYQELLDAAVYTKKIIVMLEAKETTQDYLAAVKAQNDRLPPKLKELLRNPPKK